MAALSPLHIPPQVYMELEQGKNADFWRDMTTITEDEIAKLRKLEASGKGPGNPGLGQGSQKVPGGLLGTWGCVCRELPWSSAPCLSWFPHVGCPLLSGGLSGSHQGAAAGAPDRE